MNAGEIGTEAGRIFEYNLPSNWIFRSQEDQNDFGIDGEIELKDETGKALGKESVFKVQIKGEEYSTFINEGKILSFTLKMERLKYYFEFKVPVILVVVEVSSEKIFWLPITNDENLRNKISNSNQNESTQIHIPIENTLIRKNIELSGRIVEAVIDCWDYLSIKGLKDSVARYSSINRSSLNKKIEDIGEVLFKAYHQQLNNFLFNNNFHEVFKLATEMATSAIVPARDKFVALLYYWQAFQVAPYTNIMSKIYEENYNICHWLINLAREQRSNIHRLIAIGKSRITSFKFQLNQLHATHHSIDYSESNSLEHLILNRQTQDMYRECCLSLQKIIELCNRLTKKSQYHILSDLFVDVYPLILVFKTVHEARGSKESIEFLDHWHENMSLLVMKYCVITKDFLKIERLYFSITIQLKQKSVETNDARELILSSLPELEQALNKIEQDTRDSDDHRDFYSLTIEEQKKYFLDMAKSLGMDPDDPDSDLGHIVDIGLKNYDPTCIMKNCESLFVLYRPAGIVAKSLRMHSAGGMHLLICLKHGHAQGTGYLLRQLYDNSDRDSPDFGDSFKQQSCDKCLDCKPRSDNWSWSLKWYQGAVEEYKELLNKYKF